MDRCGLWEFRLYECECLVVFVCDNRFELFNLQVWIDCTQNRIANLICDELFLIQYINWFIIYGDNQQLSIVQMFNITFSHKKFAHTCTKSLWKKINFWPPFSLFISIVFTSFYNDGSNRQSNRKYNAIQFTSSISRWQRYQLKFQSVESKHTRIQRYIHQWP